jgi:hypothetical protein
MSEECLVCRTPATKWDESSLKNHIRETHLSDESQLASAKALYQDNFPELFTKEQQTGGDPEGDEETQDIGERTTNQPDSPNGNEMTATDEDLFGRKWFMIGIGGAGNNILDAILMRRDTLVKNNKARARIWQGGLAGYGSLNTAIAEIADTYYSQIEDYNRGKLLSNSIIGYGEHNNTGMGYRWDKGAAVAKADFSDGGNPFRDRYAMSERDINDAQAIMFIHSVTKGTGCGATPVIASEMRDKVLTGDGILSTPMFSSVVIPTENEQGNTQGRRARINGVTGLGRLSQAVDAILPFNNEALSRASTDITTQIDHPDGYTPPPNYADLNKPLVAFLEAFTMSSTPKVGTEGEKLDVRGGVFDPSDSYQLVLDKYPSAMSEDERPAVILAPALGRVRGENITEGTLNMLIDTMLQNKLADFKAETAWGGSFIVYGPPEKMEQLSPFIVDGQLQKLLSSEEYLDVENTDGAESIDIQIHELQVPYLDDLYMWGTFWNPELPSLKKMYESADALRNGDSPQAESVRQVWDDIENLFDCLGRKNLV